MKIEDEIAAILKGAAARGLPSLVIGANAVILLGYIRNTADFDLLVPEEKRSEWLDLLRELDPVMGEWDRLAALRQPIVRPAEGVDPTDAPVERHILPLAPREVRRENFDRNVLPRRTEGDGRRVDGQHVALVHNRRVVAEILRGAIVIEETVTLPLHIVQLGEDVGGKLAVTSELVR